MRGLRQLVFVAAAVSGCGEARKDAKDAAPVAAKDAAQDAKPKPIDAAVAVKVEGPVIGEFTETRPALRGPMPNRGLRKFARTVAAQVKAHPKHFLVERVTDDKVVALTFDDGPDPAMTPQLLAILADKKALATFFVVGERVERYPELIKAMRDAGHAVAGHGYRHIDHRDISVDSAFTDQFTKTDDAIAASFGTHAGYWRPPYGAVNAKQLDRFRKHEVRTVLWSVDSLDWSDDYAVEAKIRKRVLDQAHPGAVILLHSGARRTATAAALPAIIDGLEKRGYRFDTIEGLFALERRQAKSL